jgi:putative restriction endonuclease
VPRPEPLPPRLGLVHPRMGTFKPRGERYAASVIAMLKSPYPGDRLDRHDDGSWDMVYHQQNPPPGQRGEVYTNAGLQACLDDAVPLGVLQEYPGPGRKRMFEVVGLATLTGRRSGYIFLQSLRGTGHALMGDLITRAEESDQEDQDQQPLPPDDYDARLRTVRQIFARRGQRAFRASLLQAYSGCCAVTGCTVTAVLEAAHLRPYRGPDSNVPRNGLPPKGPTSTRSWTSCCWRSTRRAGPSVVLSRSLHETEYARLAGLRLAEPRRPAQRPAREALEAAWQEFTAQEAAAQAGRGS